MLAHHRRGQGETMIAFYTDGQIVRCLEFLVEKGIDIDQIPLECPLEDIFRMARECKIPN